MVSIECENVIGRWFPFCVRSSYKKTVSFVFYEICSGVRGSLPHRSSRSATASSYSPSKNWPCSLLHILTGHAANSLPLKCDGLQQSRSVHAAKPLRLQTPRGVLEKDACNVLQVHTILVPYNVSAVLPLVLRAQKLCESRGGRPGFPSLISLRFLWK